MSDYLEYKGFLGTVEYSSTDNLLHGEVAGIRGLIMYHGDNIVCLTKDFQEAVDHYLASCEENGLEPQVPCYGTFDVRIPPALHKQLQIFSMHNNKTQNETIADALKVYITA